MNTAKHVELLGQLQIHNQNMKLCLDMLQDVSSDKKMTLEEKMGEIKKIKEQIFLIMSKIDDIKREIRLMDKYNVN